MDDIMLMEEIKSDANHYKQAGANWMKSLTVSEVDLLENTSMANYTGVDVFVLQWLILKSD